VDIFSGRLSGSDYCLAYDQLPGNKSGRGKPGEELKNGVIQMWETCQPSLPDKQAADWFENEAVGMRRRSVRPRVKCKNVKQSLKANG
jgi:hypothetical protein